MNPKTTIYLKFQKNDFWYFGQFLKRFESECAGWGTDRQTKFHNYKCVRFRLTKLILRLCQNKMMSLNHNIPNKKQKRPSRSKYKLFQFKFLNSREHLCAFLHTFALVKLSAEYVICDKFIVNINIQEPLSICLHIYQGVAFFKISFKSPLPN